MRVGNLSFILEEYLRELFAAADASLRQRTLNGARIGGPSAPPAQWTPSLASALAGLAGIGPIIVTDAAGLIRRSTQPLIVGHACERKRGCAELLPYVFERFRQQESGTTRRHGGLGLGLAIVRHLVELHGGSVRAESEGKGVGRRFACVCPRNRYTEGARAMPTTASPIDRAVAALKERLGARANDAVSVRDHHSHGESYHTPAPPDIVCFPTSTDEVAAIVQISAAYRVPVIPFGAGTSLEGHVNAIRGGISIDLREMNRIVRVSADDLDATVEAGVTRLQLNKALANTGLHFPVDPGADATIGGMTATRASGTTAVRYGTMRENVLRLTVVLADGSVIRTGTRARKSSAGYDLTRLFVGSEGTLGVITEVTVRLHPLPEAVSAAVCAFESIRGAVETVIATIQLGVPVARIELLDEVQMDAVNRYSKTGYEVAPTLFFEFHSDSAQHVAGQAQTVQALALERGGRGFAWATHREDRERLWQARHTALYAALALRPGGQAWTTDVCVPISRLAECIVETKQDTVGASFPICLVGHAGDGNFHVIYVLDTSSIAELDEATRLNERMVMRALAMGGTCSGEHGVGVGKMKFLEAEHGAALDVMRSIKRALDPDNRMNPGKMV